MSEGALVFHISTNARRENRAGWGDTAFAESLAESFAQLGHETRLFYRGEAPELTGAGDVVLRIVGPHLEEPVAGAINLLWVISPPNLAPMAMLRRYDHVLCCSSWISELMTASGVAAEYMPQATDPALFVPDPNITPDLPVVFVGSIAPRAPRRIVLDAIAEGIPVAVWGGGWAGKIPEENYRGERVSSTELAAIYARAQVVLNSHMPHMARMGMMSNRSFDAVSSGAAVLSDAVRGWQSDGLPVHWATHRSSLRQELDALLSLPQDAAARAQRHALIAGSHSFTHRARRFVELAQNLLRARQAPAPQSRLVPSQARGSEPAIHLCMHERSEKAAPTGMPAPDARAELRRYLQDPSAKAGGPIWLTRPEMLDAIGPDQSLSLELHLSDPQDSPDDVAEAMGASAQAVQRLCALWSRRARLANVSIVHDPRRSRAPIHGLCHDHRQAQRLFTKGAGDDTLVQHISARAQRVSEALSSAGEPFGLTTNPAVRAQHLTRAAANAPLFAHERSGYDRDRHKVHLRLWPRANPVSLARPVGVFIHLYYDELAPLFHQRLEALTAPYRLYLSTDTPEKAERIGGCFPEAEVRVFPNCGRDIFPKLYGFSDRYKDHDLVLHLHGKRSRYARSLDGWLTHNLDCLLPDTGQINRILSLFSSFPKLGMVGPVVHKPALSSAHWADNFDIAQELAERLWPDTPLPSNDTLRFPSGSMFWARTKALESVLKLRLSPSDFPPEQGQQDATTAHALERLIGICCERSSFAFLPVAPQSADPYPNHSVICRRNAEVADVL